MSLYSFAGTQECEGCGATLPSGTRKWSAVGMTCACDACMTVRAAEQVSAWLRADYAPSPYTAIVRSREAFYALSLLVPWAQEAMTAETKVDDAAWLPEDREEECHA